MTLAMPEPVLAAPPALLDGPQGGLIEWALKADAANKIAKWAVGTSFVPETLRVRDQRTGEMDYDLTLAQVTMALMKGDELRLGPMASLESIDIIPPGSGQPALRARVLGALLHQHGHRYWIIEKNSARCILRGRARGAIAEEVDPEVTWDIDRARNLVGAQKFNDPRGNWRKQPETMLYWRALAELSNLIAPEVRLGLPLLDIDVWDMAEEEPAPAPARKRAAAAKPRAAPARRAAAAPPAEQEQQGEPAVPMMADPQRRKMWAGMRELGIEGRDASLRMVSEWLTAAQPPGSPPRQVGSSTELTAADGDVVLDAIKAAKDERARRAAVDEAQAAAEGPQQPERQAEHPDDDPGPDEPEPGPED
jgi:hypothetical protein